MDYEDKLLTRPWYNFVPPRQYIFVPPLTGGAHRRSEARKSSTFVWMEPG